MREAIETAIAQNRLPVLMTKADDIEGGHRINQDIADLAAEYELPIVNFWAAVQDLPFKGLQQDGIHLTFYKNDFSDPRAYDAGDESLAKLAAGGDKFLASAAAAFSASILAF